MDLLTLEGYVDAISEDRRVRALLKVLSVVRAAKVRGALRARYVPFNRRNGLISCGQRGNLYKELYDLFAVGLAFLRHGL